MKTTLALLGLCATAGVTGLGLAAGDVEVRATEPEANGAGRATREFTLSSPDLPAAVVDQDVVHVIPQRFILNGFGCTGENVSPALHWKNVPKGTKSLTLLMFDPDAPTGSGFYHWAVYNIPPTVTRLAQGAGNSPSTLPPPAFGGTNDLKDTGVIGDSNGNYGGPCAPAGDTPHRYTFTLYALAVEDVQIAGGVPKTATPTLYSFVLNKALGNKLLGKASFTAMFGR